MYQRGYSNGKKTKEIIFSTVMFLRSTAAIKKTVIYLSGNLRLSFQRWYDNLLADSISIADIMIRISPK
jgi:hypothetical protein